MANPRAVIYIRLSRDGDESTSVATQRAVCEELCQRNGWDVALTAEDVDVSGATKLEDRPGMVRVLGALPGADYVVAAKLDRYARSVLEFTRLMTAADAARTTLITADGTLSPTTSKLVVHVLSAFAEFERDQIRTRILDSRDRLRKQGRWLGGAAPYGYVIVARDGGKYLDVDAAAAKVVREAVRRVIDGEPVSVLVNDFNARGIDSPAAHKRRRAGKPVADARTGRIPRWTFGILRDLLVSQSLTGALVHDARPPERRVDARGRRTKPRYTDFRPVLDENGDPRRVGPPIVSDTDHRAVREAIEGRKMTGDRKRNTASLLLHVAECGVCTGPLYHNANRTNPTNTGYVCKTGQREGTHAVAIDATRLEDHARAAVMHALGSLPLMRRVTTGGADNAAEIADAEAGIETLAASLATLRPGSRAAEAVTAQLTALERKLDNLAASQNVPDAAMWEPTGTTFADEWAHRSTAGKRALLLSVGTRVIVAPREPGAPKRWDPSRVRVDIDGPEWHQEDPHAAMLADIVEQEARAEAEPLNTP